MLKNKPINTNSKRSIALITDTLLELMNTKPLKKITIAEITQKAGLVRNTFYAHFATKEDVLSYYISTLFEDKLHMSNVNVDIDCDTLVLLYFELWNENTHFLKLLERNELLNILNEFDDYLQTPSIQFDIFSSCNFSTKVSEYITSFYAASLWSILKKWIENGMKETPEELTQIFHELIGW